MRYVAYAAMSICLIGQTPKPTGIDRLHLQTAKPQTTADMVNSAGKSTEQWETEMKKAYQELLKAFDKDPTAKAALIKSQEAWVSWKDVEFKLIDQIYKKKDGTMFIPMRVADRGELIKARATELKSRLGILKD